MSDLFQGLSDGAREKLCKQKQPRWTAPILVAEVGFTEWTQEGRLRHPRFIGLRIDKKAEDVVRERANARPE